jgi:hypothetical protein
MKVRFLKIAEQELGDAVTWYNQQADGLGQDFLDESIPPAKPVA